MNFAKENSLLMCMLNTKKYVKIQLIDLNLTLKENRVIPSIKNLLSEKEQTTVLLKKIHKHNLILKKLNTVLLKDQQRFPKNN